MAETVYCGRFAPSPSGPLHFGSLLAALASFLDARHHQGYWLLRIEDVDQQRTRPGAADTIQRQLEHLGLLWDGTTRFQSQHFPDYQAVLDDLLARQLAYPCQCTRSQLQSRQALERYDRYCLNQLPLSESATGAPAYRVKLEGSNLSFSDPIQGPLPEATYPLTDPIIRRRDGFYAYQLAVVVDDQAQGITHVVRGADLWSQTPQQHALQQLLNYTQPNYAHIPLVLDHQGRKLSKQYLSPALEAAQARQNLLLGLRLLGQHPEAQLETASVQEILEWGIQHWDLEKIPKCFSLPYPQESL